MSSTPEEFIEELEFVEMPLTYDEVRRLAREFHGIHGNEAGGSLHIVLDDQNWEREHVEWRRQGAAARGDLAGERFAAMLLMLTDEQLRS